LRGSFSGSGAPGFSIGNKNGQNDQISGCPFFVNYTTAKPSISGRHIGANRLLI